MKVVAVTPAAAAQSPAHPDHDRWVKEHTLGIEVAHAQSIGGTLRDAEAENTRLLQRMEALARQPAKPQAVARKPRAQRVADRGVSVRTAPAEIHVAKKSPCGRCGTCRNCMRERRVMLIFQKRTDDRTCAALAAEIVKTTMRASMRLGEFRFMSKSDRDRAITSNADSICERSITLLGPWLK